MQDCKQKDECRAILYAELSVRLNDVEENEGLNSTVVPGNYSHLDSTLLYSRNTPPPPLPTRSSLPYCCA